MLDQGVINSVEQATVAPPVMQIAEAEFSQRSHVMTLGRHEVICFEGDPAEHVYQVAEGAVMLYKLLA